VRESALFQPTPGLQPTDPEFRRGIYVSIAFLCLITSDPLQAQSWYPTDASVVCNLSTGDCPSDSTAPEQGSSGQASATDHGWIHAWFRRVDQARASQPHFVSPIVTTHTILVQQFRYDMSWQQDPGGGTTSNYGASRGLEIIPATRFEVGLFPPNYLVHQRNIPDGFGDFSFQVKFRAFSAPEGHGDYFVGIFLGGSFPTGTPPNGLGHTVLSPTLGVGKGLGPWDIQNTIGANLPVTGANLLGRMIIFNTAVNYRIKGRFWPMLEQNSTFWSGGALDGRKQVFLTPGLVVGPFPVVGRLRFLIGSGVQIAVTQFHQFNHRWILSIRFPF
jgi:hypothetical protein